MVGTGEPEINIGKGGRWKRSRLAMEVGAVTIMHELSSLRVVITGLYPIT